MKRYIPKTGPLLLLLFLSLLANIILLQAFFMNKQANEKGSSIYTEKLTSRWNTDLVHNDSTVQPTNETQLPLESSSMATDSYTEHVKEPDHYTLAVMISSSPGYSERRDTVRRTWMKGYSKQTRKFFTKFVIGIRDLDRETVQELEKENSKHNDMILFPNLVDNYDSLGHKTLAGLIWFDKNVNYSYLLKCDDDTFVIPDKIEDELLQRDSSQGLYWGYFAGDNRPHKKGKWAEPNWKFCDYYFPYAYGGGYVLSADIIHRIAVNADGMIVYRNEDVSVGAWTVSFHMERKHDVRFDSSLSRGCKNNFLVTHQPEMKEFNQKHHLYSTSRKLCDREQAQQYQYNWVVPPSKCCIRQSVN